jgi:hypothetical protein
VRVQPRASRSEIVGWRADGVLSVRVAAPPVEGAANAAVAALLAAALGVRDPAPPRGRTGMKRIMLVVVGGLILAAAPARADHNGAPAFTSTTDRAPERGGAVEVPGTEHSLDINLKLGLNGFRLGSRLFGREGYLGGAWLNGETRKDGFSLDGRVEHDGTVHDFRFNAEIDEWLHRMLRRPARALDL